MAHSIAKRVKEAIIDKYGDNPNYKAVSSDLGMNYSTFMDMLNKDYDSWQSKYLIRISEGLKVSFEYLLGLSENLISLSPQPENRKFVTLPVFGNVYCGTPVPQWDINEVKEYITLPDLAKYKYSFGLIAKGDSMTPYINPGDYLVCVDKPELVKDGKAVVVVFKGTVDNNEVNAKLIRLDKKRSLITLYSVNTKYPPMMFNEDEILKIYKLIKIIREVK